MEIEVHVYYHVSRTAVAQCYTAVHLDHSIICKSQGGKTSPLLAAKELAVLTRLHGGTGRLHCGGSGLLGCGQRADYEVPWHRLLLRKPLPETLCRGRPQGISTNLEN